MLPVDFHFYLEKIDILFAENPKQARKILKTKFPEIDLDKFEYIDIGKHSDIEDMELAFQDIWIGKNAGLISDAGLPGVGDPGQKAVQKAHESGVKVVPVSGPNSFMLALMSSGLNGQQFQFHGYIPIDSSARKQKLKEMEADVTRLGITQIFMDTPYRNHKVFEAILLTLKGNLKLCLAVDINGDEEFILTQAISDWKKMNIKLERKPAVFLIGR